MSDHEAAANVSESDGETFSSMSDDEASSNVELLFQQAFAKADPTPFLLQVVKDHPTYEHIEFPLSSAMLKQPRKALLADKLSRLPSPDDYENEVEDYGPTNKYLFHCLLSGLSLKHGLTHNSDMYATMVVGLDPHGPKFPVFNSQDPEVLVVGTCIQLLLHGSVLPTERTGSGYRTSAEEVAKGLKEQKAAGIVKDPRAIQVLELAISHAETGLKPENDRDDVWDLLFPSNQALK
ncbi:hypothetical protein M413DRAFT_23069 [Hebeloma cylindrosporum]|uniref:Uncharacterized protein n=1 Tax=Hebeloma cylindrosporum TaxID=76867 RepID=A0A0C2YA50_HEBCY|nr:hypothetical protein M413DRAFT_23069 [Hebeloma cylindrosporum h7]